MELYRIEMVWKGEVIYALEDLIYDHAAVTAEIWVKDGYAVNLVPQAHEVEVRP